MRAITNHLRTISDSQKKKGVTTASTGNHGIGVALGSSLFGANANVYLCDNVPAAKVKLIKDYGAKVHFVKGTHLDAQEKAIAESKRLGHYYIHPYNSVKTICGTGTLGLEIWE